MQFNASKCSVMHIGKSNKIATYTMNKQPLQVTKKEKDLGVWITDTLKPGEHCSIVANKANRMLGLIWRNIAFKDKSTICKLYKSLVRPHLDYCIQAWKPYLKKDINTIEKVQHRATKMIWGMQNIPYSERLKLCGLMTMEDRSRRADILETYKILTGKEKINPDKLFKRVENTKTRGHNMKLEKHQVRTDNRKHYFSQRVINDWNKLPSKAVNAISINILKNELQIYLGY